MVAHPKIDTSTLDHIKRLAEGQTELAKAVGRGQPALRDPSGNILALNPASSTPLLVAQAQNVALSMREGGVYVTDETGENPKAFAAENVNASRDVTAEGDIYATGIISAQGKIYGDRFYGEIGDPGQSWHAYITAHGDHDGNCYGEHHGPTYPQVQGPQGPRGYDGPPGPEGPKGFVIDHPTDPDRWMIHACTEAPHNGVEYWGTAELINGQADVALPDYFEALTRREDRTVHLTALAAPDRRTPRRWLTGTSSLAATYPRDGRFRIIADGADVTKVFWLVKAVRADLPELLVQPLRSQVRVSGMGPYRTYSLVTEGQDPLPPDTVAGPAALIRTLWAALGMEQMRTDALHARVIALETTDEGKSS